MEEQTPGRLQGAMLILHGLAPTITGLVIYLILGLVIIGAHLLGISLTGKAYPASFDDTLLQGYANFVIQPLASLVNNGLFSNGLTIIVWGAAGWAVCAMLATLAGIFNDWRNTEKDIAIPREGVVVRHPLKRSLTIRLLWRLFISLLIVLFTALILPVIRFCLDNDVRVMQASSFRGVYIICVTLLIWMAIFHLYVVLLRLYMLRTRVLGEILY